MTATDAKPRRRRRQRQKKAVSFHIGHSCKYDIVRQAAASMGWKLVAESASMNEKKRCNIYWVDTSNIYDYFHMIRPSPWQCINHFPGMTNIARKSRLAHNLDAMKRTFPKDFNFYPQTYVLPRDMHIFRKNFASSGKSNRTFIIKPDGGCQGRGIYLTRNINEVDVTSCCVAQHYIRKPFLIDNKKFDLRIYVLVTSCQPLRMYLFNDGLVRICTEDFVSPKADNLGDRCMHLTNYAVNKGNANFTAGEGGGVEGEDDGNAHTVSEGNKRSIKWFFKWFSEQKGEASAELLWVKIREICAKTVLSIWPTLVREYNATFGSNQKIKQSHSTENEADVGVGDADRVSVSTDRRFIKVSSLKECVDVKGGSIGDVANDAQSTPEAPGRSKIEVCANREHHACKTNVESSAKNGDIDCKHFESITGSRCFEILGFDIMIDEKLKPYLIEVNHLPSFGADCHVDRLVKSPLIEQTLAIIKARSCDQRSYEKQKQRESRERVLRTKKGGKQDHNSILHAKDQNTRFNAKSRGNLACPDRANGDTPCRESDSETSQGQASFVRTQLDTTKNDRATSFFEKRLTDVYELHAPHKVKKVPALLHKYKGHEEWLISQVEAKYGVHPLFVDKCMYDDLSEAEAQTMVPLHNLDGMKDASAALEPEPRQDWTRLPDSEAATDDAVTDGESSDDGKESVTSTQKTASPTCTTGRSTADDHAEEERLLKSFQRIYPPDPTTSQDAPDYEAMERHVLEQDSKHQMRFLCPLHQCRSVDESKLDVSADRSKRTPPRVQEVEDTYELNRGDSWITGNMFRRKSADPVKEARLPTPKQIEAADRLSRGLSSEKVEKETACREQEVHNVELDCGKEINSAAASSEHVLQARNIDTNGPRRQPEKAKVVAPVNFQFEGGTLSPFGSNPARDELLYVNVVNNGKRLPGRYLTHT